ncbi:PE-PPE domain-containing protein [Amycolatopsis sp. VC5-11]|uniref:PE-PPE domain-containing protein n=1 Tax=Amycolatopsis sp. VC5-11 TaxID=3120156 RepID=UPI003008E641
MGKKTRRIALIGAVVATLGAGFASATPAYADDAHYYILIGGTCDGKASVYRPEWLQGGIARVVDYPAGAAGAPNCDQTPMDQSVAIGHDRGRQVVQDAYHENPNAEFTVVGYSQGAIVANLVLNDIADDQLGVDKAKFSAKLFADPMQPPGPAGTGISATLPPGTGLPSPFGGYVSFGAGRPDFTGVRSIRYCIQTDGICDFDPIQAAGGYFAQHWCYQWPRPADQRSIMQDSIADGVYTNTSVRLGKQDCWGGPVHP